MFMSPNLIYWLLINSYKICHCHRLENLLARFTFAGCPEIGEKTLFIVGDFPPEFLSRGRARMAGPARAPHRAALRLKFETALPKSMNRNTLPILILSLALSASTSHSANVYWDTNGVTAGVGGATPYGNWGSVYSTWGNSAGTAATAPW